MKRIKYVTVEIAELAKEKGFREPCDNAYGIIEHKPIYEFEQTEGNCSSLCPTVNQLKDWLLYNHFIYVEIHINIINDMVTYSPVITDINKRYSMLVDKKFTNYREAILQGLIDALKLIK